MKLDKAKGERAIFRKFAAKSGLFIEPKSIRSRKPPRPDISCRVAQIPHYFEVTRMAHKGSANVIGHYLSEVSGQGATPALAPDTYDGHGLFWKKKDRRSAGLAFGFMMPFTTQW